MHITFSLDLVIGSAGSIPVCHLFFFFQTKKEIQAHM